MSYRFLIRPLQRAGMVAALFAFVVACSSDDPVPYGELLIVSDQVTVRSFGVNADGVPTQLGSALIPGIPGTYSRTGDVVTVTIAYHNVPEDSNVLLDFFPGTGGTATDGMYVATIVDENTFTVVDSASGEITDGIVLRSPAVQYGASYSQTDVTVTITLPGHNLESGDGVDLDFTSGAAVDINRQIEVLDEDTFTVLADDPLTTSGNVDVVVGANYTIFGAAMHPNGRWLYVTSTYECWNGEPYCWGNDLITRFAIDWNSGQLTFEESYRTFGGDDVDNAAPVTLIFSADGTRMVNQDDDLDGLHLWEVNTTTGDLMLVAHSDERTTGQHGIAFSADGTRVYHGTSVFTVGTNSIQRTTEGQEGESNRILGDTMFAILGRRDGGIVAVSLADPDAPSEIASSGETPHRARDLALLDGGALIVASGWGGLKSYDYDGAAITSSVGAGETELRDGGATFEDIMEADVRRMYRTISRNSAGTMVAAAYFTNDQENNAGQGGLEPSGFILVDVAADGSLALVGDIPVATYARVAHFISRPVE